MDDLDHLLRRGEALHHFLAHGLFGDGGDEVLGDLVVYVGFQQRHAHFAHGRFDVALAQLALAAQLFKYLIQLFAERFKGQPAASLL